MPWHLHALPISRPALPALAAWLLGQAGDRDPGPPGDPADLAATLVLLPASRACGELGHALLEAAGEEALLLPQALTPTGLARHLAQLQGRSLEHLPAAALRPLLLAPALTRLDWLAGRPEAAPGLAAELVAVFDEVRLGRCDQLVLGGADDAALLAATAPEAAGVLEHDLARLREAWACYREVVPQDAVDVQVAALAAAAARWPGPPPARVVVAHLGRIDGAAAASLASLAAGPTPVHLVVPDADGPRAHLLLATYRDAAAPTHPLAGVRRLAGRLGAPPVPEPTLAGADLAARLERLGPAREELGPGGPVDLVPCREPEHESRVVAHRVVGHLAAAADAGEPVPAVTVATPDRDLAARITAQLRDAGIDVDDTRGRPLHTLPAGRLLRDLLRTAAGGWPYGPLFEVLRHPYVRLVPPDGRPGHAVRVQLLEAAVRRRGDARRGRGPLRRMAAADDATAAAARTGWSLAGLVDRLAAALAPLADQPGRRPWPEVLGALHAVWTAVAPDRPLDQPPPPAADHDDLGALATLLDDLAALGDVLPAVTLAEAAAALTGLLARTEVRPHRQRHLPVLVTGLVEARLASADLLVLAGMGQDVFPGTLPRPPWLDARVRAHLALDHWRDHAGRGAELLLRLLHAAPRVVITWPQERDGQPALPSPLVQRLLLVAPAAPTVAPEVPTHRRELPPPEVLAAAERAFRAEPEPIPAPAVARPGHLSHTALQRHRECPYRFLLADALGLRRVDPLEPAFGAPDLGNLAHAVMQAWLDPDGPAVPALAGGDTETATRLLHAAADRAQAAVGRDLPGSEVALRGLLALAPQLVELEAARLRAWRPAAVEAGFRVTLGQVADWLAARRADVPPLPPSARDFPLRGQIDRVDVARDGAARAAVIDYKTGRLPAKSHSQQGRALQVALYGLAVVAGAVEGLPSGPWELGEAGYYPLRGPDVDVAVHLAGEAALVAPAGMVLEQAVAILDPHTPLALVPDWQQEDARGELPCAHCEFAGVCRLQERDGSPPLAARVARLVTRARGGLA